MNNYKWQAADHNANKNNEQKEKKSNDKCNQNDNDRKKADVWCCCLGLWG